MARSHHTLSDLTAQELRRLLSYDPATGIMRWRVRLPGQVAGCLNGVGYVQIRINRRRYLRSRLAHLYMTGAWPPSCMDHINRVRDDDRWENLRPASYSQNTANMALRSDNRSGYKGVFWDNSKERWIARVYMNGKAKQVGSFTDVEDAARAYRDAAALTYGEFAR